jgi:hypothetical protein
MNMPFSLYEATIPSWLQILNSVHGLTEKAEAFCAEKGLGETELLGAHFGEDMLPLSWQIKWVSTHSIGAIEGVRKGEFSPDRDAPLTSFAEFRDQIGRSLAALEAVTPDEVESFIGRDMRFSIPQMDLVMDFTAENFLLSFSVPNFYFHATTAFDILRHQGVGIGKRDFLGKMRLKAAT